MGNKRFWNHDFCLLCGVSSVNREHLGATHSVVHWSRSLDCWSILGPKYDKVSPLSPSFKGRSHEAPSHLDSYSQGRFLAAILLYFIFETSLKEKS